MNNALLDIAAKVKRGEELSQADVDAFGIEFSNFAECLGRAMEAMVAWLSEVLPSCIETFGGALSQLRGCWVETLDKCPDRRVRHLALHARKSRTRKKNLRRALKLISEEDNL